MTIENILLSHFSRYPGMQLRDVYKLLHQAALGSEHAVLDVQSARNWMNRELSEMGTGPAEALMDAISPGGEIVRVHLRPFIAAGGAPEHLLAAFIQTANEWRGEIQQLEKYWAAARQLAVESRIPFKPAELEDFVEPLMEKGFPAVHHSPEYDRLYRPAYRVVMKGYFNNNG